jgi:hypothetical protein
LSITTGPPSSSSRNRRMSSPVGSTFMARCLSVVG